MNLTVAVINLATGAAYLLLACQALWEIARERRARGISRFGVAYVAMALSCGPHHLIHGARAVSPHHHPAFMAIVPNALVLVTYGMVGLLLFRTQLLRHPATGGWSVSGLSLAAIFPSCSLPERSSTCCAAIAQRLARASPRPGAGRRGRC
jgi:hypothetical protein